MNRREFLDLLAGAAAAAPVLPAQRSASTWNAGVATVDITPKTSLWMAGFARRKQASQGTAQPLHAKALALQAGRQAPAVLVSVDLLGVTARSTAHVTSQVQRRHRLQRADLFFNASHTHCGPVVDEQLSVAYGLSTEQWAAIRAYTSSLDDTLIRVIDDAISRLRPATVEFARGEATFAANRRVKLSPNGPVDHSVPVLPIKAQDGKPLALVFGYACHNTTLGDTFVQYHGDYAGVAQAVLEKRHPGTTALFVTGCGADANPSPRGTVELVEAHGAALADAVDRALTSSVQVAPALRTAFTTVDLPFVNAAARERWRKQLDIEEVYLQRHATLMEATIKRDGRLPAAQPDPIQVWQFGDALTLVTLGGEVVVDYARRLAREYPDRKMWVAGYSNDVFGYVPSARVAREGGYEGGDAMIYYGRPAPFTEEVEELIVGQVKKMVK